MTKTYENFKKISAGHKDDYTNGCLLDYLYFKENLQADWNRSKQIKSIQCSSKNDTAN